MIPVRFLGKQSKLWCRALSTPAPPAVPTAHELAVNDETVKMFRKLQHTAGKYC